MPHSEYLSATRLIPRFWILYQGEPHGGFLSVGFHGYTCVTPDDKLMPEVAYILPQMMNPFWRLRIAPEVGHTIGHHLPTWEVKGHSKG